MNETKVRDEIGKIISEARTRQPLRKQYPVAKHQIAKLTELGIIALMPEKFGYMDAAMVIDAAQDKASAVFNASGEGEAVPASALNEALTDSNSTRTVSAFEALNPDGATANDDSSDSREYTDEDRVTLDADAELQRLIESVE